MGARNLTQKLEIIKANNVGNLTELRRLGFKLHKLRAGAFRIVYKIERTPWVVKIPYSTGGTHHARAEFKAVKKILKFDKYEVLQPYMPEILYFNDKTGLIICEYYKPLEQASNVLFSDAIGDVMFDLARIIWPYARHSEADIHSGNLGITKKGQIKFIDLGYFSKEGKFFEYDNNEAS